MGCGGSSGSEPGDENVDWKTAEIDDEWKNEEGHKKKKYNKKTGNAEECVS